MAAVALGGFGMLLPILLQVIPVRLPPFSLTRAHILGVGRIVQDSFPVIVAAPMPLTLRLATDALLWSINQNKTVAGGNIETFVKYLPRPCWRG